MVDFAFLSMAAYMDPKLQDLPSLLEVLMPHKKISIRKAAAGKRRWLEMDVRTCPPDSLNASAINSSAGDCTVVTVIAVSGTHPTRFADFVENVRMWTEPVALQILEILFPTVRFWPRDTRHYFICGMHVLLQSMDLHDAEWHYGEILERVRKLPQDTPTVLTGHSLGGGIALVVGALTGHWAVAMQPPGIYHSFAKHQAQQQRSWTEGAVVHRRSVTMVFEGDWVQHFDSHGGLCRPCLATAPAKVCSWLATCWKGRFAICCVIAVIPQDVFLAASTSSHLTRPRRR